MNYYMKDLENTKILILISKLRSLLSHVLKSFLDFSFFDIIQVELENLESIF